MLSKFRRVIRFVVKSPSWKFQGHVDFCPVLSTVAIFTYFYFFISVILLFITGT